MSPRLSFLLLLILVSCKLFSQKQTPDSSLTEVSLNKALSFYKEHTGGYVFVNSGIEYTSSFPKSAGHPFLENSFFNGNITYNGILYIEVPMKLDLVNQELVVMNNQSLLSIIDKAKVEDFTINNRYFINLTKEKYPFVSEYGFYELVYKNDMSVLVKKTKFVQPATKVDELNTFLELNKFFVLSKNQFHLIKTEKDLLKLLGNKKAEVREVLKSKKIKFKNNPEQAIITAVDYYFHNHN
jgi:hypothetical protein